jgi:hypothetical protein
MIEDRLMLDHCLKRSNVPVEQLLQTLPCIKILRQSAPTGLLDSTSPVALLYFKASIVTRPPSTVSI